MINPRVYSTADICELFDISKNTLFRWEETGLLPRVQRDLNNQRQYTQEHIRTISQKEIDKFRNQYKRKVEKEDDAGSEELWETISLMKFLEGNMIGLRELEELPQLSPGIIRKLLHTAIKDYTPREATFVEIMRVLYIQSRKLTQNQNA